MIITTFASLKDVLGAKFEIPNFTGSVKQLRTVLTEEYPDAKNLLIISRFGVGENILDEEDTLSNTDGVFIIPPSSGG